MKLTFKILKMTGIIIGSLIVLLFIVGFLFVNLHPTFGGKPTTEQREQYTKSGHYEDGKFINEIPSEVMSMGSSDFFGAFRDYIKGNPARQPNVSLPVEKLDSIDIVNYKAEATRVTWFGHSTILLEIAGKKILIDPMLGPSPAPHPWLGSKRYSNELPIVVEKLPQIDAVILSHDHYDHLDYPSILELKDKVKQFYMPLGVGSHLVAWGVDPAKIHELDWWDEIQLDGLTFACTPARHFSGRGLTDRSTTLWGSWVIMSPSDKIYFSGDSGYGPHFKEIGEKYGPFDLAMMECGQYNERWEAIHMKPEQTAQASVDVRGKAIMPIHWGAFTLALHTWTDPVERLTSRAKDLKIQLTTPKLGESIVLKNKTLPHSPWWQAYSSTH